MRLQQILRCTVSAAVIAAFAAGAAQAQEEDIATVDDIIVTAQKREQSLQDVPIVVTSLSEELLEDAGVRDIKDLTILTPGLTVTSTSNETITTARIRGVGTVGDNPGLESSVGVVIDGVYRPRNGVGFGDLGELRRIEVLKGPQGTLFGRNTSAGVINIITESPSFEPGFEGEATAGNYGNWGVAGSVTGPLGPTLAGRLYAATRQRDGFYDVLRGDGPRAEADDQNQNFWTVRGQLLFQPSNTVDIRFIADYTKREEYCCVGVQVRTGPTGAILNALATGGQGVRPAIPQAGFGPGAGFGQLPFSRTAYANRNTHQNVTDSGFSVEAEIDMPSGATLTSISAVRFWDADNGQDVDFSGADVLYREDDGQYGFSVDTISQELRLAGTTGRWDWLVGGFFSHEDLQRTDSMFLGADYNNFVSAVLTATAPGGPYFGRIGCLTAPGTSAAALGGCVVGVVPPAGPVNPVGQVMRDQYSQESNTFALFTHNTFALSEQLDLTFGLRWTRDDKELNALQDNLGTNGQVCGAALANAGAIAGAFGAAAATQALGALCLSWANPFFDNRATHQEYQEDAFTGTANLSYDITDDLMIYGSYARGYKGAGYNLDRSPNNASTPVPFQPFASTFFPAETVDSYELGFKSTLLNGALLLNATMFSQTFQDFQLNTFASPNFIVESIPEVTSRGVDLDTIWLTPVEGLTFQGGVTYAKTEYAEFTAADLDVPSRFLSLSLLPGQQMSFAPEWSVTGALSYERTVGGLMFGFNLSGKYTSEYNTKSDLLPIGMQDALTLFNGRISIGSASERWTLDLWGQNLTDEDYYQVVFNGPFQGTAFASNPYSPATDTQTYNAFLGAPRTYGATLRVRF